MRRRATGERSAPISSPPGSTIPTGTAGIDASRTRPRARAGSADQLAEAPTSPVAWRGSSRRDVVCGSGCRARPIVVFSVALATSQHPSMSGTERRDGISRVPLSPPLLALYPRRALTTPAARPRRFRYGRARLAGLAALIGAIGCVGSLPAGWVYVTLVDRTAATIA